MAHQKSITAEIALPVTATIIINASYGEDWNVEAMHKQLLNAAYDAVRLINSKNVSFKLTAKPKEAKIILTNFE